MPWVSLLTALLQVTKALATYLQQRQLLDAGKAIQMKDNLDASLELLGVMDKARADAVARHNSGVPDDGDKYRRD